MEYNTIWSKVSWSTIESGAGVVEYNTIWSKVSWSTIQSEARCYGVQCNLEQGVMEYNRIWSKCHRVQYNLEQVSWSTIQYVAGVMEYNTI